MTAGNGGKRPQREELAIAALLSEPTVEAAAKRAGISESTLLRWMAEPVFREQYRAARRAVVEGAIGRLQQASTQAVDALARNLTCGNPAVEVGAAKAIFELTAKGMEQLDFAERLEAIEKVLGPDMPKGAKP
jgi:hypothetical protein